MTKHPPLAALACLASLAGCAAHTPPEQSVSQTEPPANTATLAAQINDYKAGFAQRAPKEKQELFQQRIDDLGASGILDRAKNVGDTAPAFTLPNAAGEPVSLLSLLAEGPVILNWYRGGWCPYCNLTLRAYQDRLEDINAAGATFVAISPETPDNSLSTQEKNDLAYPVLTDLHNATARRYGLVFKLQDDLAEVYNDAFDLNGHNADKSNELPLAATYIIDRDGVIRYAFLSSDYRDRAEPAEVLDVLGSL